MSSGADQRTEPPLAAFEPLTEYMSSAIEERPKSARQGIPSALMRMLYYKDASVYVMGGRNRTNTLQVPMNDFVSMQVVQTTDDAKQLEMAVISERGRIYTLAT